MEVVFKVLMEKKRGTQVAPELINTNLSFTSHAGDAGAGPQVIDRQKDRYRDRQIAFTSHAGGKGAGSCMSLRPQQIKGYLPF